MNCTEQIKAEFPKTNGVYYSPRGENESISRDFEDIYIRAREKEGRLYDDATDKLLPEIERDHKHYREWRIRKNSARMLRAYISKNTGHKDVLEIGCGNGWLSARLAEIAGSSVTGLDINRRELEQAVRVFGDRTNLVFVCGDVSQIELKFDYIILAGVIAYFNEPGKLIESLLSKLNGGGEIHIIESPFYNDTASAKKRSADYYQQLGAPEMAEHYHHHKIDVIKEFNYQIVYNPKSLVNRVWRIINQYHPPFYWVRIRK
jgi:SAM-dependent methyltransferase